ncbi:hypothetical protein CCR75_003392 [Bremia lactucae]|uniref:Uncharacterized protein n=1 Tax=Bremia lactucae TaxID=4779 RepID=A0A976NY66_BRELC|nr:hypothetical protein CCR75_003392 [Bremia lactucae]
MQDIGIDIDEFFDQWTGDGSIIETDEDDISQVEPNLHIDVNNNEIDGALCHTIDDALKAGFASSKAKVLRELVAEYRDVWCIRIGAGPPADVESLRVFVRADAQPYRAG